MDLLILWPQAGRTRRLTRGYMDRCGAESGHLIVFDRAPSRTWEQKIFRRETPAGGRGAPVTVWGM